MTYRQKGHSRTDPAKYRPEGELEEWLARDPILLHGRWLAEAGVEGAEIDAAEAAAREAVAAALERALAWPEPEPAALHEDVWVAS
jgi:pyruvate dehydrogenase E1 component alpha subunit